MTKLMCLGTAYKDCDQVAEWVRYTQFSGDHPFCDFHAKEQIDFNKNDSYGSWGKASEYKNWRHK